MLIDFKVKNFRSFKEEIYFSMEADSSKSHPNNYFEKDLINGDKIKLLKLAAIYGPNASGKTNLIRAFSALKKLINNSSSYKLEDVIDEYDPYALDVTFAKNPTAYEVNFIGPENYRFKYSVSFNETEIVSEELIYYPKSHPVSIYERSYQNVKPGTPLDGLNAPEKILAPRLYLSYMANEVVNEFLGEVYKYFNKIFVFDFTSEKGREHLQARAVKAISDDELFKEWIATLLKTIDTGISNIESRKDERGDIGGGAKDSKLKGERYFLLAEHNLYNGEEKVGTSNFNFRTQESHGTQNFLGLGWLMYQLFYASPVGFIDEIHTSLHSDVSSYIIGLIQHPAFNKNNSQLIFSTHDTALMDKLNLRKDQMWFTEKEKTGGTELYSAQDFKGIDNNISFQKWYEAGKFRAKPIIDEGTMRLIQKKFFENGA